MRVKGTWPEVVQIRRGWALARARPWNDRSTAVAALRLDRGGDRFLTSCAGWLWDQGVERVLSPAMPETQTGAWRRAGFRDHLELVMFERDLRRPVGDPIQPVVELEDPDMESLAQIDDRAFDATWQVGRLGLVDAVEATPLAVVLAVLDERHPLGFSIVGEMAGIAYLQRLAVSPGHGRQGIGRSLVRASIRWARHRGTRSMLLNTQPENDTAAALYADEGFVALARRLRVLTLPKDP
jgi:ribosomal protein S18 acetylase RimI-like enzyme